MNRRASWLLFVVVLFQASGCAHRTPVLEPLRTIAEKTPVVLIPGITGSQLRNRETGEVLWGTARAFFAPRDGGYALARPIGAGAEDVLEAFAPLREIKLLGICKVDIYASLARLMESNGYREGDLDDPRPGETFFFFPYDWRYGAVRAAHELTEKLERLRQVRGTARLHVTLVGQSNAGRIARYFVKYGGASLEEAEAGRARRPPGIEVDKLILVGTANGGGLRTLDDLHRGRRYIPWIGRKLQPETIFTMESVYEELPFYHEDLFFDSDGGMLDVDVADAASWKSYGWSIYRRDARERTRASGRTDLFGDEGDRAAFLAEALDRAKRLHRLLMLDVRDLGPTRYYSVQSRSEPTPERALLDPDLGRRARYRALAEAPGDGHATLGSQMWLSPRESAALAREPVYVAAEHRRIVLSRAAQRSILEFLLDGAAPAAPLAVR